MKKLSKLSFLCVAIILVAQVFIPTISMAFLITPDGYSTTSSVNLGIQENRTYDGRDETYSFDYNSSNQNVFKIGEDNGGTLDFTNLYYCLQYGIGFGENLVNPGIQNYKYWCNLYDENANSTRIRNINAVRWLANRMYVPGSPTVAEATRIKEKLLSHAGIDDGILTDNDIDVIQQFAIWSFVRDDMNLYNLLSGSDFSLGKALLKIDGKMYNDDTTDDFDYERAEAIDNLYNYLVISAKSIDSFDNNTRSLKIDSYNSSIVEDTVNSEEVFLIGPFSLTGNENEILYDVIFNLQYAATRNDIYNYLGTSYYKVYDENMNLTNINSKINNGSFYIAVLKSAIPQIAKFYLSIDYTEYNTKATIWLADGDSISNMQNQPVLKIEKESKSQSVYADVLGDGTSDLVLRKYIYEIERPTERENIIITPEDSRKPVVDGNQGYLTGDTSTAVYTHPKNPITVRKGDIVKYYIRIYNEGEIIARPQKITDYLPEGLEFLPEHKTNVAYGWEAEDSEEKIISTSYLSDNNIAIPVYNYYGGRLPVEYPVEFYDGFYYVDIPIICKVSDGVEAGSILRNIAEIAEYDKEDRDSDADNPLDIEHYNPPADNSTYLQDDDDYEQVIVEELFDLSLRKYISKVTTGESTINYEDLGARQPNIDKSALNNNGVTTADYKHKKDPVLVEQGSLVNYKIVIYNEGDIAGRATKVVDQLPEGLEFVSVISGNFDKDGTNTTGQITLVRKEGNVDNLAPYTNTTENLDSETIEIQCRVTAMPDEDDDTILTNIAWIEEASRNDDIDSATANTTLPTNLVTINDNGYINIDKNRGLSLDSPEAYFEGQEDDDDFEKVILKHINGEYGLVLVKEDAQGEQLNERATFEVNGVEKEVTGRLTVADNVRITPSNFGTADIYEIVETVPPDKYSEFAGTIKIEVAKKKEGTSYVVDEDNLKYYVDDVEVRGNSRDDLNVYFDAESGNIFVKVKDYQFDLALRKYISSVTTNGTTTNYEDLGARQPNVDKSAINNNGVTTADYMHKKDPVVVEEGSLVNYKIVIYNEGDIAGRATKVVDQLPAGVEFVSVVSDNFVQQGTNTTGQIILVRQSGNEDNLDPYTGGDLDSETIEIKCKVTALPDENNNKVLTNIAWIDDAANSKNTEDRDSVTEAPRILPSNTDLVTTDTGYINEADNAEKVLNNPESYFKGQEDDDDFEKVILKPVNGLYSLALIKKDSKERDINKVATFEVNGTQKQITGRATVIENVNITPAGVNTPDEYTIKEVVAPEKYGAFQGTIKVIVSKKKSGERYVIDKVEYLVDTQNNGNFEEYDLSDLDLYFDEQEGVIYVAVTDYQFDLSLRKYISNVERNGTDLILESREPKIDTTNLKDGTSTTAKYVHSKEPVTLKYGDIVTFTLRVYNEGELDGYVKEITDYLPEELGLLIDDEVNANWLITSPDEDIEPPKQREGLEDIELACAKEGKKLELTYKSSQNTLLKKYGTEKTASDNNWQQSRNDINDGLFYQDVKIKCVVLAPNTYEGIIKNIAEISDAKAYAGTEMAVIDRDSEVYNVFEDDAHNPGEEVDGYTPGEQDDDDFEPIQLKYFDLALRKFITGVNDEEVNTRIPTYNAQTGKYDHTKEPVAVTDKDIVTYTIRVYNEGTMDGYAEEIEDDIPDGLIFLPENEINTKYMWKMYYRDENNNLVETDDIEKAEVIRTEYLSQANGIAKMGEDDTVNPNEIKAFSKTNMTSPNYKDVQIAFKVAQVDVPENNTERIIINKAHITKDSDDDEDSTPDKWIETDDDQDIEKIYLKEFDMALYKWVTQTVVTVDDKTTTTETGFEPNIGKTEAIGDNYRSNEKAEPIAKVEVDKKKLSKTTVKFVYNIKVVNEGEIDGYVTEITDYIPEGLEFIADDNPLWTIGEKDGTITTRALEKVLLEPGKSATIPVIFTWKNDSDNLGIKTNIAAITEDYNEKHIKDIDSIIGNEDVSNYDKEQEDDDDFALVILALKTGAKVQYIGLILGCIAIIATGVILIKKYVL